MGTIADNLQRVQQRIAEAAERSGRAAADITLVAVSKTISVERIQEAISAGVKHLGENRVQEAREKIPQIDAPVTWHMIGHLQRNKAKYAVRLFDMIQSIDNQELAQEVDKRADQVNRVMPVLIEVNTSGEASKFGVAPEQALELARQVDSLPNLQLRGFMTIAVFSEIEQAVRDCFKRLREIYETARTQSWERANISVLSMGMSHDFEWAIEEGATMVRIGTAIFGPRREA